MSLIKLACLDKEAAGIWQAIKSVGKAITGTASSIKGNAKQKIEGAASGFKHGDIGKYSKSQSKQIKNKSQRIAKLLEEQKEMSASALEGQRQQAGYYNKKIHNLKIGGGIGIGLAGGLGYGSGKLTDKEKV